MAAKVVGRLFISGLIMALGWWFKYSLPLLVTFLVLGVTAVWIKNGPRWLGLFTWLCFAAALIILAGPINSGLKIMWPLLSLTVVLTLANGLALTVNYPEDKKEKDESTA